MVPFIYKLLCTIVASKTALPVDTHCCGLTSGGAGEGAARSVAIHRHRTHDLLNSLLSFGLRILALFWQVVQKKFQHEFSFSVKSHPCGVRTLRDNAALQHSA